MKIIQKQLKVNPEEYYLTHLNIINSVLEVKLSEKEIDVLAAFMSLDEHITGTDMFNTYARKLVKDKLGMSPGSLSNHLRTLTEKNYLQKEEESKRITINVSLLPEDNWQGYQFKIIKK